MLEPMPFRLIGVPPGATHATATSRPAFATGTVCALAKPERPAKTTRAATWTRIIPLLFQWRNSPPGAAGVSSPRYAGNEIAHSRSPGARRNAGTALDSLFVAPAELGATKLVDASSPALPSALVTGTPYASAALRFYDDWLAATPP